MGSNLPHDGVSSDLRSRGSLEGTRSDSPTTSYVAVRLF